MDKRIKWCKVTFSEWNGHRCKEMMITSGVAIWRKSNTVLVKIKWVLLKDPHGILESVLLGCTDFDLVDEKVVCFFVRHLSILY